MNWTEKQLHDKKKQGKIRDYRFPKREKKNSKIPGNIIPAKKSKALEWLELNLQYWCNERALTLEREVVFDEKRKWRFDFAIRSYKIAVEFEGGIFLKNSGHNTAKHYTKDTEKYNRAQVLGWKVIRITAMNYETVLEQLNEIIKN
jgi:very-short-patch-repair endonuclease